MLEPSDCLMDAVTRDRIVLDPAILAGKPLIRGTRLSVEFVIGLLADACLAYARGRLRDERIRPSAA